MSGRRENFPVGSRLIRADLRGPVMAFYAYARAADDVADDPAIPAAEKLARLDAHEAGLDGDGAPEAMALRAALAKAGHPETLSQARKLLDAFRFDARGGTVATWDDLLAYCQCSADPVGRFLLDLHGEEARATRASDALCTALQVLNHLQDMGDDHRTLGRRYLPAEWMEEAGAPDADLARAALSPPLRRVMHRALDACDGLIAEAASLPDRIRSRRLAAEAGTILRLARRLAERLRRGDPLAARIGLTGADFALAATLGLARAIVPRWPAPAERPA